MATAAPVNHQADDQPVRHKLQVHFDSHHYKLTDDELTSLADDADLLAKAVGNFPMAELRVLIEQNGRAGDFSVKLSLLLPNHTIVGSDQDANLHVAFERSMQSVLENVRAYKDRLGQVEGRRKAEAGTQQDLTPDAALDFTRVDAAAAAGDYAAFRAALAAYDDPLRLRAGRWVERYPNVQARLGRGLEVVDVAEEVFLLAFEGYAARPQGVPFGTWLEGHLDQAVKALDANPDGELENINMARAACAITPPAEAP